MQLKSAYSPLTKPLLVHARAIASAQHAKSSATYYLTLLYVAAAAAVDFVIHSSKASISTGGGMDFNYIGKIRT